MIGLSLLTAHEVAQDPQLRDPSEMAAWRHYDFASGLEAGRALIPLGVEMRSAYYGSEDLSGTAKGFFRACASAAAAPTVTEALSLLNRADGFRVSAAHPDNGEEFMGSG
jgi:hypothetical protein